MAVPFNDGGRIPRLYIPAKKEDIGDKPASLRGAGWPLRGKRLWRWFGGTAAMHTEQDDL